MIGAAMIRVSAWAAKAAGACVLFLVLACRAGAQNNETPPAPGVSRPPATVSAVRAVWMWPSEGEGGAAQAVRQMERAGIDTIFLLVFSAGHTAYPSRVFPQQDDLRGQDPVAAFVNEAHARSMRVFAAIDTLYWQRGGASSPAVAAHPERMETNAEGGIVGDDGQPGGAFASPSSPEVVSLLQELVAEFAAKYPFDGVALDYARLARSDYLGYSLSTRLAYLAASGMDPADIDPLGYATGMETRRAFAVWLEGQVSSVVERLSASFRRVKEGGLVAAVVLPDYYQDRLTNPARQDWLTWAQKGWVDTLIAADVAVNDPRRAASQKANLARGHRANVLAAVGSLPAGNAVGVADAAGFAGTVLWAGDSLSTRRAMLREFGGY